MPSLFRFLFIIALLIALGFSALWAMVLAVDPGEREIIQPVPLNLPGKG